MAAEVQEYVAVNAYDPTDKVIKYGPFLWDGVTQYEPGPQYLLLLLADAMTQGYTWPPPEGSG